MAAPNPIIRQNPNITKSIFLELGIENLYQIDFTFLNREIQIKCWNTSKNAENIYSYEITSDDLKLISYKDIKQIYQLINNNNCSINRNINNNNNNIELKIEFDKNNILNLVLEKNKVDQISTFEDLKKEIKHLSKKLNLLEKENEKLRLNCIYNSFNMNSYKLENIFNVLKSDIIRTRKDFGLINQGIYNLFNKNIISFNLIYKSDEDINIQNFQQIYQELEYSLIVVLTKDKKRFGAFNNNKKILDLGMNVMNNLNNNMNIMNNNQNMMNNMNNNMMNINQIQNNMAMNNNPMLVGMNNMDMIKKQNNNNMGNPMNNNMNNQSNKDVIFNSSFCSNKYFVFSIDDSKIYFSDDNKYNFSVLYDFNRQCLYGNETNNINSNINLEQSYQTIAINTPISLNNSFKLSGKSQFNVKTFELYQIILENN